jgi:hypothetical protein
VPFFRPAMDGPEDRENVSAAGEEKKAAASADAAVITYGEGETMTTEARPTCYQDRQTCCRCVLDKGHDGQCVCVHGMVLFWTRPPAPVPS